MSEYTQGICGDAAAILKDGQMMTIEEIVSQLSNLNRRVEELEKARAVLFNGFAVYEELTVMQKRRTSVENVIHTLNAIIRVQKKEALNSTKEPS